MLHRKKISLASGIKSSIPSYYLKKKIRTILEIGPIGKEDDRPYGAIVLVAFLF